MTDLNERLLRLNAALDGELDAMGSLAFERELRDDPAIAAEAVAAWGAGAAGADAVSATMRSASACGAASRGA